MHDIIAKATVAAEPRMNTRFKMEVPHRNNCFEVGMGGAVGDECYTADGSSGSGSLLSLLLRLSPADGSGLPQTLNPGLNPGPNPGLNPMP